MDKQLRDQGSCDHKQSLFCQLDRPLKMSAVKKLALIVIQWTLVLVFGMMALVPFLWNMLVKGPRHMLYVKKREKRPEVLDDPDLGTHKFARLKVLCRVISTW